MAIGFGFVGLLLFMMAFVKLLSFVLVAGVLAGVGYALIYSIPYGLIGQYHTAFKVGYTSLVIIYNTVETLILITYTFVSIKILVHSSAQFMLSSMFAITSLITLYLI